MAVISSFPARFDQFPCLCSPLQTWHAVLLARKLVIVHKELFQFPNELLAEIGTGFDVSPAVSIFFDCDDAIVSDLFLLVALLALDNANRAAFEDAPWKGGFIHQHQYVNGVTIVGFGRGNKSEVVRKGHTSRQNFLQFENVIVNVKSKL